MTDIVFGCLVLTGLAQHSQHAIDHVHSAELNAKQILDKARNLRVILALKLKPSMPKN